MKKVNPGKDEQLKTCWGTMLKYIGNVAKVGLSLHMCLCNPQHSQHAHRDSINPDAGLAFTAKSNRKWGRGGLTGASSLMQDPKEEKYRKIRLCNAAFQARVGSLNGALKFLEIVGFQQEGDFLVMPAEKATADTLNAAGGELNNASTNPFFGVL